MPISYTHINNAFVCEPYTEHGIASSITSASLDIAYARARQAGVKVDINAVILPGEEAAIAAPAKFGGHLQRT
ncbi:MAG: hypothetical protein B7Y33_00645, partial [Hydrogenophilales bacterium 16-62-9]